MKKFSALILITLISISAFADIQSEINSKINNDELANCVRKVANRHNYTSLSEITDLDCSCNGFYPPFFWWGQDVNKDAREACEEDRSYGSENSSHDKNFIITSFAGLEALTNLKSLNLSDNDFSDVAAYTNLEGRNLSNNEIKNHPLLRLERTLRKLVIKNSDLLYIPIIPKSLRVLDVSNNNIGGSYFWWMWKPYSNKKGFYNLNIYKEIVNINSLRYLNIQNNPISKCDGELDTSIGFIIAQEMKISQEQDTADMYKGAIKDELSKPDDPNDYMNVLTYTGKNLRTVKYDAYCDNQKTNCLSQKDRLALEAIDSMTQGNWEDLDGYGEDATVERMLEIAGISGHEWMEEIILDHFKDYVVNPSNPDPIHYRDWLSTYETDILGIEYQQYTTLNAANEQEREYMIGKYYEYIFGVSDPDQVYENYTYNGMNREELLSRFLDKMNFNYKYFYLYYVQYPSTLQY